MASTSTIDIGPSDLLDAWLETRRQIAILEAQASHLLAERMRLMKADAAEQPLHRTIIERSMVAEYAAAGRIAHGTMDFAFTDAAFLEQGQPDVLAAFRAGTISAAHVREIVRASGIVREAINNKRADAAALATFDTAARVVAESETPARTAVHVKRLAAALAGGTVVERHARSRSERAVTMRPVDDGLALLTVVLPEHLAAAIMDRLTQLARGVVAARQTPEAYASGGDRGIGPRLDSLDRTAIFADGTFTTDPGRLAPSSDADTDIDSATDFATASSGHRFRYDCDEGPVSADSRTIDQVRADLLTDLLLAAEPSPANGPGLDNIRGRIQVTIAATTLAGLDERPAELDGYGPLHPDHARDLAGRNLGWSRLFLDAGGLVTETDTYTPTEPMRRFLRARDQHCRFPGCRMPLHRCDIDHTRDHAKGGRTDVHNLAHLCRGHHSLKHPDIADDHRWSARQLPDGTIDWLSPSGRSYRDSPQRRVMFV
ncbi:HNH endonuclease signature motif containing protein [Microbacterium hydrocarbonoxydans]|uniref:HNH endonuclease signature motif containing protein n=1 Tax=Microbacterium hydrocarbonoxydans TaxID=273678 RepID=UPI00203B7773|nr:HNH endonuclease signature motif containing protein [Microbacterium hydrocarbonoxydans]MCM3780818.1 HNH endonuclease [Microbacterium hydrocarbonoxydans]